MFTIFILAAIIFSFCIVTIPLQDTICRICSIIAAACSIGIMVISMIQDYKPKAIEVYRGKTELKIEDKYINGELVKSDTIVVYKKL